MKRPFSELSESSGVFSEQLSECEIPFSPSHDLSNTKTTILGGALGAIPRIDGNPHEIYSFAHAFSERLFKNWGGPSAPEV